MAPRDGIQLEITYQTFGWIAFILWSISFYPQVFLDFKRMHFLSSSDPISLFFLFAAQIRVVGLDLDEAFLSVLDI